MTNRQIYPTDLSDTEWHIIEPLIPAPKERGRKIKYSRREILNAIFYLVRSGCVWRLLPHDLPPYRIVFYYYTRWRKEERWQAINDAFRTQLRLAEGRDPQPSAASIDSQSVKTAHAPASGENAPGYDAGKKIKGRKRHILVDAMGLLMVVVVHSAGIQDRDGAKLVFAKAKARFPRLKLVWADGGYGGKLVGWLKKECEWALSIIKRNDDLKGFKVLPRRWVVERTFGWLLRYRRLSKDYEYTTESSEAMVQLAMIRVMLKRLAQQHAAKLRKQERKRGRDASTKGYALVA
jgi:putative transposase